MAEFLVDPDADGHVTESDASLRKHLKEENRARPFMGGESWDRRFGGKLGKMNEDPRMQLADMDAEGIDIQVIYPSHLSLSAVKETDLAVDLARAWNDWIAEFCAADPRRLKGIAQVALQDVDASVREARRAVEELGLVGIMMPTNVLRPGHRPAPVLAVLRRPSRGWTWVWRCTAASTRRAACTGASNAFISVHSVAFPFECMAALTGLLFAGVPEQFPKLRIAALEAAAAGCRS